MSSIAVIRRNAGFEAMRRGGFTKNDVMTALLRAGTTPEIVEEAAQNLMDEAQSNGEIRPFANSDTKWNRISG